MKKYKVTLELEMDSTCIDTAYKKVHFGLNEDLEDQVTHIHIKEIEEETK